MILSVIVVNWNTQDLLVACLRSLAAFSLAAADAQAAVEIIVVDNASTDGSPARVRRDFPHVRLIENPHNLGFAAANNLGIQASRGEFVLLLNSDAAVTPGALTNLVQFMQQCPPAGLAGPRLINPDGSFQASFAAFPTLTSELLLATRLARWVIGPYAPSPTPRVRSGRFSASFIEAARPVDWIAGAAMLARRRAIEQVGGLDEGYFMYSEETDWCWRFWRHGWQVWYLPHVAVVHHGGASTRQRPAASYAQLYASKVRFFTRAYGAQAGQRLRRLLTTVAAARLTLWRGLRLIAPSPARAAALDQHLQREQSLLAQLRQLEEIVP